MQLVAEPLQPVRVLIEKAQCGDRPAFEALVRLYEERFRALIRSRLSPELTGDLDDVFQESLLRAYRSLERFEWRGEESFLRWLGGIAEHVILDLARRDKRRPLPLGPETPGLETPGQERSPSNALRQEERLDRLGAALARLSPDHRRVLELAHREGLRTGEIAVRMERSPAAVRQLLWRALKALRADFGDTGSWSLPPGSPDGSEGPRLW